MTVYYDSCIFGNALNGAHPLSENCSAAVTASAIAWVVVLSREVSIGEMPSIEKAIDAFFIDCALAGVTIVDVSLASSKASGKLYRNHKKSLSLLGFQGDDWNHLMSCVSAGASQIWSTDEDFFDPANKSKRGTAKRMFRVSKFISSNLGINVSYPP